MNAIAETYDGFVTAAYKHVVVKYHIDNGLMDLPAMLKAVDRKKRRLGRDIGIEVDAMPVEIEIFSDRKEWLDHHTYLYGGDMPSWVQGDSGRIIRVTVDEHKVNDFDQLLLIVEHETIHHLLKQYTGHSIPAWLDEGLALFLTQELPDHYRDLLKDHVKANTVMPFEMLNQPFTLFDRNIKTLAYAQSYTMVAHLTASLGWPAVKGLLDSVARKENLDRALMAHGLNFYLLEREWIQSLDGL